MLTSTPSVLFFIWIYGSAYSKNKDNMSLYLRNTWLILIAVIVAYVAYMILGITAPLWQKGIWFTENDVLHVGMIYWVYYIMKKLPDEVKDMV
jgi:sterol desaturase/sphingolipid hydroxylase (fatty acid hydroxylase superfamily)